MALEDGLVLVEFLILVDVFQAVEGIAFGFGGRDEADDVVVEAVGFLAVDGVVADEELFVGHAQGDAADVFDEAQNQRGPNEIPADDEEGADDLQPDLFAVAVDGAARVGQAEGRAGVGVGEDSHEEAAEETGDHVRVRDAEGVVDVVGEQAPSFADDVHGEPWDRSRAEAEEDRGPAGNHTGSGRDGHEAGDHAVDRSDDGWFAVEDDVHAGPREHAHGGTDVGVEHGGAGIGRNGVRILKISVSSVSIRFQFLNLGTVRNLHHR